MKKHLLGFALIAVLATTGYSATDEPGLTTKDVAKDASPSPNPSPDSVSSSALKEFTYKEYRMGFSMPGDPVASSQSVDSALGKITIHSFILEKGDSAIMVMVNVYPEAVLKADPEKLLAAGRDGAVDNIKAKVTSQREISIDGHPGIEFEFESEKYHGTYRIYLVGVRLYQLGSLSAVGADLMAGTDPFMASFHLLK